MPDDLGHVLRHLGHTVVLLREVLPNTTPDTEVLSYAADHELVMVTCNRDDFEPILRGQTLHFAILLL